MAGPDDLAQYAVTNSGQLPPDLAQYAAAASRPPQGLGMQGASLTNASSIPNARLRNLPNPAAGETSNIGALYHGAKMGATLASIPMAASLTPGSFARMLVGGTAGTIAGQQGSKALGAGQFGQEVSGDIGGLLGAGLTEGAYNAAKSRLQSVYNALPKAVQDEIKNQALGTLSPRAKHFLGFVKALNAEYAPAVENTAPQVAQAAALARGAQPVVDPAAGLGQIPVRAPGQAGSMVQSVASAAPTPGINPTPEEAANNQRFLDAFKRAQPSRPTPNAETSIPHDVEVAHQKVFFNKDVPDIDVGNKIREANPEPTRAEVKAAQAKSTGQLSDLLDESLGVKKPIPGVKLRDQAAAQAAIPEGHIPLESSALKSYKYDPSAREFTAAPKSGPVQYVYGDVSPEDAAAFEKSESKGKAWQDIRNSGTLVAKIVDGKRIPIKPARPSPNAETGDLSDLLKQSVQAVKARKLSTGEGTP